jgi:hypothetical protein
MNELMNECCPQDGVDEITDEETLSLLQLAVHTPEVARNVMYPVFFAVGALLLAAVAIFIYHRLVLSVLFALGFCRFFFFPMANLSNNEVCGKA